MTDKPPIEIPADEVARQAVDTWGGYIYQLDHTVLRWLGLRDDEILHVELAEDIAVSADGSLDMTQIKRVQANITLRSKAVAKLIAAVWKFQTENPGRLVSGALLTTSRIGKEKGLAFPGDVPGLVYWRAAARGGDVEPIRKELLCLDLPQDLRTFVGFASADELRQRILTPIQWQAGGPSPEALRRDVEEQLILMGAHINVPANSSINVRDGLITALLDTIPLSPEKRYVTKAHLIKIFHAKTLVTLPPALLQAMTTGGTATAVAPIEAAVREIGDIPLSRRAAMRQPLVDQLRSDLVSRGTLWFHGSSGLGKSTLAMLVARAQKAAWHFVDLRDVTPAAARSILSGIAGSFRRSGLRGLIVDDIPADPDNALISAIGQAAQAVADADGVLIITGTKPPPPTLAARLGLNDDDIISVPYLTQNDVAEMVHAAGGDLRKWASVIHAFAGSGHPQLVDARIAGLEQRGWDEKELMADVVPLPNTPDDMAAERQNVRNRLIEELRPEESELLLRLSLLSGNFDRPLAVVVAGTSHAIPRPGMVFDFLVGPWIEQIGEERYRLSPLLKDSGTAGLADAQQRAVRSDVIRNLTARRPFPADMLLQVFLSAFPLGDHDGLSWFGHAVLQASTKEGRRRFKRLAQELSAFALFDRGEGNLLVPDDTRLSTLLRFAQIRVAVATDDFKQTAFLVDRALAEEAAIPPEQKQSYRSMIESQVLIEPRIPMSPRRWMAMLEDVVATPEMQDAFSAPLPTGGEFAGLPPTATHDEMLFIGRATASKSIAELAELIDALEQRPKAVRDRYFGAASRIRQSLHLIVAGSWLAEVRRPGFDPTVAAATLQRLSETESARDNPDLAVELLCAKAVMLDEYAEDEEGALNVLADAQEKYPNDYRLHRQRQKVFYRHNQHAEALAEFEKFQERMPKERALDRAYAMREAARSAAEIGDLSKAGAFFGEAWESARLGCETLKPMAAGLSADCAIVAFDVGDKVGALEFMRRSLIEAEGIDPKIGLKYAYIRRVQVAAIIYMRGVAPDFPVARQARVYGMCSEPEPDKWFGQQPQVPTNLAWYELAELETETSDRQVVLDDLRKRTKTTGLLPLETMLATRAMQAALRELDADRFLEWMRIYPRAVVLGVQAMMSGSNSMTDPYNFQEGKLEPVVEAEWAESGFAEPARMAVLSFLVAGAAAGREDVIAELRAKLDAVPGLGAVMRDLFEVMDEPRDDEDHGLPVIIPSIAGRLLKKEAFDGRDMYLSAVYILQLLEGSVLAAPVAERMMEVYVRMWSDILEHRSFSLRSPTTNGPIVQDAMHKGQTAKQRMANMVLALEATSGRHLSDALRDQFAKAAAPREKPEPKWPDAE